MKTKIFPFIALLATLLALCTACQDLNPQNPMPSGSTTPYVEHIFTVAELFPEGDELPFLLYPRDGWTLSPGQTIVFKALLLNEDGTTYSDVTNKTECKFDFSYGSGKSVYGGDPSLQNGQEITIQAVWNKKWGATTTGKFIDDRED